MEHKKTLFLSEFVCVHCGVACFVVVRVCSYTRGLLHILEMMGCDGKHASSAAAQVTFTAERLGVRSIQRSARGRQTHCWL
jgi:hypothetical protein